MPYGVCLERDKVYSYHTCTFQPCMQEEYIKEEQRNLKRELLRAQEEVRRIQSVPLVIGQFLEMVDNTSGIVGSTTGRLKGSGVASQPRSCYATSSVFAQFDHLLQAATIMFGFCPP